MIRRLFLFALLALPLSAAEDDRPVVDDRGQSREKAARGALPSLWIAGDSTVKCNAPMRGWGQDIGQFFDPGKINVVNRAIGGRSSRTFYTDGRWQEILKEMKKGDFVLIQFGHNDVGSIGARNKFRGTLKGIGDETEEVEKPDGSTETVHSYGWYLRHYASTARDKGATVILCSPIPHKRFDSKGKFIPDWDEWRDWVKSCATAEKVYFIDLAELIGEKYAELGQEKVELLFADKGTHTSAAGALLNAETVVEALGSLSMQPLKPYLSKSGKELIAR